MVRDWLYGIAAILCAVAVGRILFLLCCRQPVQALTGDTDLTEMQRLRDRDMVWVARADNLPTEDDIPFRVVMARVAYEVDGVAYRADVRLLTRKGAQADTVPIIWYDPADPSRATGSGPGQALFVLLIGIGLAVVTFECAF